MNNINRLVLFSGLMPSAGWQDLSGFCQDGAKIVKSGRQESSASRNQAVSRLNRPENDFIYDILFQDFPWRDFGILEKFPHHRLSQGSLKRESFVILVEIEEGADVGIAGMLGKLFIAFR